MIPDATLLSARRFDTGAPVRIEIAAGRISTLTPLAGEPGSDRAPLDESLPWVAPGFVDLQINGYGGQEFSALSLTPERVAKIVRAHFAFGVVRLCPTLTTESFAVIQHGVTAIRAACERCEDVRAAVAGIHLEGPYFSTEDGPRGAHPAEHCRRPNWAEFQAWQEAAGGLIRILTMSPEFDEAPEFIARVVAAGVLVAIGHTGANGAQIRAAVDAGARLSTHLGNGAHRMLRRHPNYIWDQLAEDRLSASLIVDGHHLPAEVVQTILRAKTADRILLVSDVSGLAGLPPGRYQSSGCELEILDDGRLVIAGQDQLLAGASQPIGVGVANVMRFAKLDLATAIHLATRNPARLIGLDQPAIQAGAAANLVLFDLPSDLEAARGTESSGHMHSDRASFATDGLRVRSTILGGKLVYDAPRQ